MKIITTEKEKGKGFNVRTKEKCDKMPEYRFFNMKNLHHSSYHHTKKNQIREHVWTSKKENATEDNYHAFIIHGLYETLYATLYPPT